MTLANAGHLAPYCSGEEVSVLPALPLGIVSSPEAYEESSFTLKAGGTLTFLSDGAVEARNAQVELFGFERLREISTQSADEIAAAAQRFGQYTSFSEESKRLAWSHNAQEVQRGPDSDIRT
ncbi:MAG: SpoIIE family protein phosphatase [Terracidiphilus sp.]